MMLFPSPRWVWTKRGFTSPNPPTVADLHDSMHPDVRALSALYDGPGWYPQVRALVEEVEGGLRISFWDCNLMVALSAILVGTRVVTKNEGSA